METEGLLQTQEGEAAPCYVPRRYVWAALGHLGFVQVYVMRIVLSVAVVPMKVEYGWSSAQQGYVLASFFWGYICTQVLGGYLATRLGGKWVLCVGVGACALLTVLTPVVAEWGGKEIAPLLVLRVLEGVAEGVSYPAMHAMIAAWAPVAQKASLAAAIYSGSYTGTVLALPLASLLIAHVGWPSVFYVAGAAGLAWALLWALLAQSQPARAWRIAAAELRLIGEGKPAPAPTSLARVPWLQFARAPPLWALLVNHFAGNWAFYTLLTWLPTFFTDQYGLNWANLGVISSLPYLCLLAIYLPTGLVADLASRHLSVTTVRKIFETVGFGLSAAALVALGYVPPEPHGSDETKPYGWEWLGIGLMCLAVMAGGISGGGYQVNHLDLSPRYAGVLMGITNTVGTVPGMVSPVLVGYIINQPPLLPTTAQWRTVFYIAAGLYIFALIIWLIFAKGTKIFD